MKLHQKLLLGFATVALLVTCVGYVAQQMNQRVQRSLDQLSETAVEELVASADMGAALRESLEGTLRALVLPASEEREHVRAEIEEHLARFESALSSGRNATHSGRMRATNWQREDLEEVQQRKTQWLEAIDGAYVDYRGLVERILAMEQGPPAAAMGAEAESLVYATIMPAMRQYREAARNDVARETDAIRTQIVQEDRFLFVSVLLGIGITLVLGILIAYSISAPISRLREVIRDFGRGRLDRRVRLDSDDEVAELGAELNRMAAELSQTTVSKQYLDMVLASMSDPLIVLDQDGQMRQVNGAAAATIGVEDYQMIGRSVATILVDGSVMAFEILSRIEQSGRTGNLEVQLLRKDGSHVPVVFSAARMLGPDGEGRGIVCVAKDITAQKMVERELVVARTQAEEMARMKSSFLANMSHEIRTPLTGIIGSSQVLADMAGGDALEVAHIIERAGVRLLGSINSVLDMARIEAGQLEANNEALDLAQEVHDAASVLHCLAEDKGLELTVIEPVEKVWIDADPGFVNRIVTNLAGNAIKFTEDGWVRLEIDLQDDETALLRVSDSGIGMSEDFLPDLFQEFRQASGGVSRTHEGSGLGLAITKSLVDLMGATIEVKSVEGEGTIFTVAFRRVAESHVQPEPEEVAEGV